MRRIAMNRKLVEEYLSFVGGECREQFIDRYRGREIELPPPHIEDLAEILSALSNPIRLSILWLLLQLELPVCLITAILGREQSLVSHHLKKLRDLGIVIEDRKGKFHVCKINPKISDNVKKMLIELENVYRILVEDRSSR